MVTIKKTKQTNKNRNTNKYTTTKLCFDKIMIWGKNFVKHQVDHVHAVLLHESSRDEGRAACAVWRHYLGQERQKSPLGSQASPVFVLLVGCEHTAEKWERS